jgi:hypothetical protein
MILACCGYKTMLPPGRSFPAGLLLLNQRALVFLGFITPMGTFRHLSLHTYEGRLAVLSARMPIARIQAWLTVM